MVNVTGIHHDPSKKTSDWRIWVTPSSDPEIIERHSTPSLRLSRNEALCLETWHAERQRGNQRGNEATGLGYVYII